jgi:hypothetical protein
MERHQSLAPEQYRRNRLRFAPSSGPGRGGRGRGRRAMGGGRGTYVKELPSHDARYKTDVQAGRAAEQASPSPQPWRFETFEQTSPARQSTSAAAQTNLSPAHTLNPPHHGKRCEEINEAE